MRSKTLYTNGSGRRRRRVQIERRAMLSRRCLRLAAARELAKPQVRFGWGRVAMKLREIAHSRTGDKGNTSNISVIRL